MADGRGRPTKLTPEREGRILEALRGGATWAAAAAAVGIDESTIHDWRKRDEEPFSSFSKRCTRAVEEGEADAIAAVRNAFTRGAVTVTTKRVTSADGEVHEEITERTEPPDATMALRWLERRRPKGWSPTNITKHIGAVPVEEQAREVRITLVEPEKKSDGE